MHKTTRTAMLAMLLAATLSLPTLTRTAWGAGGPPRLQGNLFQLHRSLFRNMGVMLFDDREKAPDFSVPDLSGKTVNLSDYRGRLILLNFWATWCVPCRQEIPTLNALKRKMAGRPFALLSVAMDHDVGHIPPFLKKVPVDFLILAGRKGKVDNRYFGLGLPQTYLIDPEGYLIGKATGARDWQSPAALKLIESLLPKTAAAASVSPTGDIR